ncbi:sensor histidine kinase [Paenibacillus sp. 1011MAR3C5]|uniref:sensor histidine kinase n=1 Tax=Paenibacillus sp. 1011MAR3C5 TaxID=1675787 RepID=UPI000E6C259E|nr:ATP-binding protein [Paenibacillus sp. 1011MAR3C5]RJE86197.1 sensor histidine kinase [Paenibacillus sp. 1011MAR3C5]
MKRRLHLRLALVIIALAAGIVAIATISIVLETHYHFTMYQEQHEASGMDGNAGALAYHLEQALIQTILWTGLGSITLAVILGFYVARRISEPLVHMKRIAERMSSGQWHSRVHVKGEDELAQLGASLNSLADQLRQQEQLRVTMTEDIAHELRTPLATLKSHMRAMEDGIWAPTPERIHACCEEIERLAELVAELEDLTHVESPTFQLDRRMASLEEVIRRAGDLVYAAFREKGVDFICRTDPGLQLAMDPNRMMQIMVNLLSNALKHTPQGGAVYVEAVDEGAQVSLLVKDTGSGIPAEELPYIFERFYRAEKSRSRRTGGSGLGLTIVKQLVTAHGGTLYAESGEAGTSMYIKLPKQL